MVNTHPDFDQMAHLVDAMQLLMEVIAKIPKAERKALIQAYRVAKEHYSDKFNELVEKFDVTACAMEIVRVQKAVVVAGTLNAPDAACPQGMRLYSVHPNYNADAFRARLGEQVRQVLGKTEKQIASVKERWVAKLAKEARQLFAIKAETANNNNRKRGGVIYNQWPHTE